MRGPNFGRIWINENCYGYAINRSSFIGNPGQERNLFKDGRIYPLLLRKAIQKDGATLVDVPQQTPTVNSRPRYYLIAVRCDAQGINYHVLRRDEFNGKWYSKVPSSAPGLYMEQPFEPIRDDWNVRRITTNQGMMMVWVGYFWIPLRGL